LAKDPKILNFNRTTGVLTQPLITETDLYVVPVSTKTTITGIHCCNTNENTKSISFKLSLKPASGDNIVIDIAATQKIEGTSTVTGGGLWTWEVPYPLEAGDKIIAIQETNDAIDVTLIGFEEVIV